MTISRSAIAKSQTSINAHQAALDVAKADKAYRRVEAEQAPT